MQQNAKLLSKQEASTLNITINSQ